MNKTKSSFAKGFGGTKETIIISLGGSLVAPGEIDIEFLNEFKKIITGYLPARNASHSDAGGKTNRFIIIVGGGRVARMYQKAIMEFGAKSDARDWMGINITKLNAEVVRQVFNKDCYPKIISDPNKKVITSKKIMVGAGWKPGCSTDKDAVLIAKSYNVKTIINLTNIDYVYDKNPKEFADAKPIELIEWKKFQKLVGNKWSPGISAPFDPIASKLASKLKLKVVLINGHKLDYLKDFLENKPFIGTTIQ